MRKGAPLNLYIRKEVRELAFEAAKINERPVSQLIEALIREYAAQIGLHVKPTTLVGR
jgi:hypothetical protein